MTEIPSRARAAAVARAAVMDGVIVCREAARRLSALGRLDKADDSPVTVADFASQAVIVRRLRSLGSVAILGEEAAAVLREPQRASLREAVVQAVRPVWPDAETDAVLDAIDGAGHVPTSAEDAFWAVDPIDGTRGFVRGGQYAVCLAWIAEGRPQIAAMGCPNLSRALDGDPTRIDPEGTLLWAEGDGPLWVGPAVAGDVPMERVPIVSAERPATVIVTHSVESRHSRLGAIEQVLERLVADVGGTVQYRPCDSQAKYAMVARGQAHVYLRIPQDRGRAELLWDHAPGWLLARAAGSVVTDLTGAPFDFTCGAALQNNYGVVCAPPSLHGPLLQAIAALGLDRRDG